MKILQRFLLLYVCVVALLVGCSDESDGSTSEAPPAAAPERERDPPPDVPAGPMWDRIATQMATMGNTKTLARESLLDKNIFTVMVCGSASPLPTTSDAQSCTAVFVNGQFLLFDAGDGAQRSMEDLNLPMTDLSAVFITHYHNDHFADIGEVIQRSWTAGRRHKLPIYGGTGLTQFIGGIEDMYALDYSYRSAHHGDSLLPKEDVKTIPNPIELGEGESVVVYENDGVVVTAFDVHHPPVEPAFGYTVTYQGRKVVISGDTADEESLYEYSRDADVLVSEVMNKEAIANMEALSAASGNAYGGAIFHDIREYHIDVNEVGALAEASNVGTLILTHQIPKMEDEMIMNRLYTQPIRQHFSGELRIAHDGTRVRMLLETDGHEIVTEHYDNGAVRSQVSYIDDVKDGPEVTWYKNGELKSEIIWTMGSGQAVNYDKNGDMIQPSIHPEYSGETFSLNDSRALIVTTSVSTLGEGGAATGVFGSEMTAPYYEFMDAGMEVDVASIKGGEIPIDPISFLPAIISSYDERYLNDDVFKEKTANSPKIDDLDFTEYDVVFLAGGWGAAYDLGFSEVLGERISAAYEAGILIGAICHGPLGLLKATDESGDPLVEGRRMTGVTDKQVSELGIEMTPQHPETELKRAGAIFESITSTRDFMSNYVVADGQIVTGQNQNSGAEVAHWLMELIEARQ